MPEFIWSAVSFAIFCLPYPPPTAYFTYIFNQPSFQDYLSKCVSFVLASDQCTFKLLILISLVKKWCCLIDFLCACLVSKFFWVFIIIFISSRSYLVVMKPTQLRNPQICTNYVCYIILFWLQNFKYIEIYYEAYKSFQIRTIFLKTSEKEKQVWDQAVSWKLQAKICLYMHRWNIKFIDVFHWKLQQIFLCMCIN